jgi:hypothetical protein
MPRASIARVSPAVKVALVAQMSLSAHQPFNNNRFKSVLEGTLGFIFCILASM